MFNLKFFHVAGLQKKVVNAGLSSSSVICIFCQHSNFFLPPSSRLIQKCKLKLLSPARVIPRYHRAVINVHKKRQSPEHDTRHTPMLVSVVTAGPRGHVVTGHCLATLHFTDTVSVFSVSDQLKIPGTGSKRWNV